MIYNEQLKNILANARNSVESGDKKAALAQIELADMYADHHKFTDPRVTQAIQHTAKQLGLSDPDALQALLFMGIYEAGRIVSGSSFDVLKQVLDERKLTTVQMMLPYFGVNKMTAAEESAELSRIYK